MKKYILDFRVVENTKLHDNYALLKLKPDNNEPLPDMLPGQFVEVRVDRSPGTFLRRPISINFVDSTRNELWLLIRKAGEGTRTLCDLKQGDSINLVLPLGNTFSLPDETDSDILLIGGGVGIAPMLYSVQTRIYCNMKCSGSLEMYIFPPKTVLWAKKDS